MITYNTLLFLEKCTQQVSDCVKLIDKKVKNRELNPLHLIHFYRSCRHLQLRVQIYNVGFADTIFWDKNISMSVGIMLISFSVLLFKKSASH
ncbi:unnamed protein product, partial [Allacma fusca]